MRRVRAGVPNALPEVGPRLQSLIRQVWLPDDDPAQPIVVTDGAVPDSHVRAEEYAVLPSSTRPRLLVPVGKRRANIAAFSRYNTTSSATTRAAGTALALAYGTGAGDRVFHDRIVVAIDRRIPRRQWGEWLVLRHAADVLGVPTLVAQAPVRRSTPTAKPTLRLFDADGHPRGHMKLGWSSVTRALVRNEAETLYALSDRLELVSAPRVLTAGTWRSLDYLVTETFPAGIRRWRGTPFADAKALSAIVNSGEPRAELLKGARYIRCLRDQLAQISHREPAVARVLSDWLDRLVRHRLPIAFGRWHGDWVSWNLGNENSTIVAWDWEHSQPTVPAGFDLLHWHFQHQLAVRSGTLAPAIAAVDDNAHQLAALGLPAANHAVLASLYLLEIFTRSARMAAAGAGWNTRLYPDLLRVAQDRDVAEA